MRRKLTLLVLALGVGLGLNAVALTNAAEQHNQSSQSVPSAPNGDKAAAGHQEGHGISQQAVEIARPFGFSLTNSMLVS